MNNNIFIISNGISIIATYIFVNIFFVIKLQNKNKEKWLYLVYFLISTPLIIYFRNPNYNVLIHILSLFAVVQFYEGDILKKSAIIVLIYSTKMVIDGSIYNIANALGMFKNIMKSNIWTVIISMVIVLVSIVLKKYFRDYAKRKENQNINYALMLIIPLASIFILTTTLEGEYRSDTVAVIALLLLAINMASYMIMGYMLRLAGEAYKSQILELENKSYYNEFLLREEKNSNIRSLKHDINHHLFIIKTLTEKGEYQELIDYIKRYEYTINEGEIFANTTNVAFDSIVNTKLNCMLKIGVSLEVDININDKIKIDTFDLIIIMGNILDNMIEALTKAKEKSAYLQVIKQGKYIKILAKNTFEGERKLQKTKFLTTKKDKQEHGLGLTNIEKIARKYEGELIPRIIDNEYFQVEISLFEH